MKAIGIDTVIMIRSGYRKFITYPSEYLIGQGCYKPSVDLLDMYLRLADKYRLEILFQACMTPGKILGHRTTLPGK